ncbi:SpvB/TcaC N-terminal domain-containing protein [Larkinella terrae]|uniref:Toxin n=1 Tax=Larkinella terrae TaxID=2025311 RepID=A0A7K0ESJ3_9BACT|nr:SpvB/TcaC N-terminal domain-containing protein [Larkinella terrae]MRS64795.1 toxin [Larkinella terrae]
MESTTKSKEGLSVPTISLPKGGGAIHGIGEKFAANPVTGTGSISVPLAVSPGRSGFGPQLSLSYDSGAGNGPFGMGWNLALPSITRKTDKGLPRYADAEESDVFMLAGAEDLVPVLGPDGKRLVDERIPGFRIERYRPRTEGLFARIERWMNQTTGDVHWRSFSKDNVLTVYGLTENSRITDPADPQHIFSWLICETRDDKGNGILYEYKPEDGAQLDLTLAHESNRGNRSDKRRKTNRYVKRIRYGNRVSLLDADAKRPRFLSPAQIQNAGWLFEAVFDYGEHDDEKPLPTDSGEWLCRTDPFSTYRAGFEVRTYRLCQRVLMFHHFPEESAETGANCLVRSTNFRYQTTAEKPGSEHQNRSVFSFISSITQLNYKRAAEGGYLKKSLPPLEFFYSQPEIQEDIREVDAESLENLPDGLDGVQYQWVDLDGEGLSGILTEQAGGWFYKPNLGDGQLGPMESVLARPSLASLSGGRQQLLDLAGDGQLDLADFGGTTPGFYERTTDQNWEPFRSFPSLPNIPWGQPNLRFVDLNGDGHADVLIAEDQVFTWYPSRAEDGFDSARRTNQSLDEELGPRLVFADGTQSIYLADMCGDGLTDLVRIQNGEICYWPNLGYGRFGAKVTMDNSPWFDTPDQFSQQRIRLADIDGSGQSDLIYLGRDHVSLYFNESGNGWSAPRRLSQFPRVDNLSAVTTFDLLGNGTACLVWSSPLSNDQRRSMRYIDLMGGHKPHLLVKIRNNLGAETTIAYAPSTKFYRKDKQAGKPWITRLPFPVHCVEKVTVSDQWRQTAFSTTYSYHHGYFDGVEREFRGFGRVEQLDSESYGTFESGNAASPYITNDKTLYQPPVKTVTWYHTGAPVDRRTVLNQFASEYFPKNWREAHPGEIDWGGFQENELPEPDLVAGNLSAEEWRQALRACKGMLLRQEVYELDLDTLVLGEHRPTKIFTTAYHNCHIRRLQAQGGNRHAVFLVTESEAITYQYELNLTGPVLRPDPRIAHSLNLRYDDYGNVLQSIAIAYPRLGQHQDDSLKAETLTRIRNVQQETHLSYTENRYTDDYDSNDPDHYRLRQPCEILTYELGGVKPKTGLYFSLQEWKEYRLSFVHQAESKLISELDYHQLVTGNTPQKRLVEHVRMLFFKDDAAVLTAPLALGKIGRLGLPYETYTLALTDSLLDAVFSTADGNRLDQPAGEAATARMLVQDARVSGYLSGAALAGRFAGTDTSGQYWIRSGMAGFAPDAAQHFFLPENYADPFGNITTLQYDGKYDLFVQSSTDARGNTTRVTRFDFRVLAPLEIQDINNNFSEVYFDILGLPTAVALRGKGNEGDNLTGFTDALANPSSADLARFFDQSDLDEAQARSWLGNATGRHLYYLGETVETLPDGNTVVRWGQHPACSCGILRERHLSQLAPGAQSPLQIAFEYSDGAGAVVVKKVQAEPETAGQPLRWIATGKTIFNNKNKPVKQYEPYFCPPAVGHRFEEPPEVGVTSIIYYDSLGRTVRTEMPDGSLSRVEFSPWHSRIFDRNDTVMEAGNAWRARKTAATASPEEKRAAQLAAEHADTPALTLFDSLGREVVSIAHNRVRNAAGGLDDEKYVTFTKLDAEGKPLWIRDARNNLVMQYLAPAVPANQVADPVAGFVPCYDVAGNLLFQHSMDGGDRWTLNNAAGKTMLSWDLNERQDEAGAGQIENRAFFTRYDSLLRPVELWLTINNESPQLIDQSVFIDTLDNPNLADAQARNLCGQLYQHRDGSGLKQVDRLDFKGNPLELRRQLAAAVKAPVVDWKAGSATAVLETETFVKMTEYDALNRMTRLFNWHRLEPNSRLAVYEPAYNPRGLLVREELVIRATKTAEGYTEGPGAQRTTPIRLLQYDAKGQKQRLETGNRAVTRYQYDPETFRLLQLRTTRPGFDPVFPNQPNGLKDANVLQNLLYTYDPVGNVTEIRDDAYEPAFFKNQLVEAVSQYTYDALYQLVMATGRENGTAGVTEQFDESPVGLAFPVVAPDALRSYTEEYRYDSVGNIGRVRHVAGVAEGWTRTYDYDPASNRLSTSLVGNNAANTVSYRYDSHGNLLNLSRNAPAQSVRWNHRDMIAFLDLEGGGRAYYTYDSDKQRTRKRLERQGGMVEERIDLGGLEIYRKTRNGTLVEEIESNHLMEGSQRILLVDDVLTTDNANLGTGPLYRYQAANHLSSAVLELDDQAQIISYEEYYPFGSTAYQARRNRTETPKRYRFTGKERDEESGLYYHGARYYTPWLGRWTSCDPIGTADGLNVYWYVGNNPIKLIDPTGKQARPRVDLLDSRTSEEKMRDKVGDSFRAQMKNRTSLSDYKPPDKKPDLNLFDPSALRSRPKVVDPRCLPLSSSGKPLPGDLPEAPPAPEDPSFSLPKLSTEFGSVENKGTLDLTDPSISLKRMEGKTNTTYKLGTDVSLETNRGDVSFKLTWDFDAKLSAEAKVRLGGGNQFSVSGDTTGEFHLKLSHGTPKDLPSDQDVTDGVDQISKAGDALGKYSNNFVKNAPDMVGDKTVTDALKGVKSLSKLAPKDDKPEGGEGTEVKPKPDEKPLADEPKTAKPLQPAWSIDFFGKPYTIKDFMGGEIKGYQLGVGLGHSF